MAYDAIAAALRESAPNAGAPPPGITAAEPAEAARCFAVYRNNVATSLARALAARFPVVAALVGADFFAALARAFAAANPPRSPVLIDWGGRLPAFIARFPPLARLPYLADVARIEAARGEAVHAADADPVPTPRLAAAAARGGDLALTLHPSLRLVASPHPALSIWTAHQPGAARAPLPPGPEAALIARRPDFALVTEPLDAPAAAFLRALAAHPSLARAAAEAGPAFDPAPTLARLLTHGLITDAA